MVTRTRLNVTFMRTLGVCSGCRFSELIVVVNIMKGRGDRSCNKKNSPKMTKQTA